LNADEAKALTDIAHGLLPAIDKSIVARVHINYIRRPHWIGHPERDVLGDIPTIGWIKGTHDYLAVPDELTHQARWAKAQGHSSTIADHPNVEAAVRSVGSNGHLREHIMSAVVHLLRANPLPDGASNDDHSMDIANKLQSLIKQQYDAIDSNLQQHDRSWSHVDEYVSDMPRFARWCLENQTALNHKTIKLIKEEQAKKAVETRKQSLDRVARNIRHATLQVLRHKEGETPPVKLIVAPTGIGKSTLTRVVVRFVIEHLKRTVVILVPRHRLGDEQIELLKNDYPDCNAAVWRGRHAWDPNVGNGREQKMCRRTEEAQEVEGERVEVLREIQITFALRRARSLTPRFAEAARAPANAIRHLGTAG
jgi:hypothetical protein